MRFFSIGRAEAAALASVVLLGFPPPIPAAADDAEMVREETDARSGRRGFLRAPKQPGIISGWESEGALWGLAGSDFSGGFSFDAYRDLESWFVGVDLDAEYEVAGGGDASIFGEIGITRGPFSWFVGAGASGSEERGGVNPAAIAGISWDNGRSIAITPYLFYEFDGAEEGIGVETRWSWRWADRWEWNGDLDLSTSSGGESDLDGYTAVLYRLTRSWRAPAAWKIGLAASADLEDETEFGAGAILLMEF